MDIEAYDPGDTERRIVTNAIGPAKIEFIYEGNRIIVWQRGQYMLQNKFTGAWEGDLRLFGHARRICAENPNVCNT